MLPFRPDQNTGPPDSFQRQMTNTTWFFDDTKSSASLSFHRNIRNSYFFVKTKSWLRHLKGRMTRLINTSTTQNGSASHSDSTGIHIFKLAYLSEDNKRSTESYSASDTHSAEYFICGPFSSYDEYDHFPKPQLNHNVYHKIW